MTPEQLAKMLYRQNGYMDMPDEVLILTNQAADMLLKQQDRIEELEDKIDRYRDGMDNAIACLRGEA